MSDNLTSQYRIVSNRRGFGSEPPNRVDVTPWTGGSSLVRLGGHFPTGWAGHLTLGLARAGLNVVRGFAQGTGQGRWAAQFQVVPTLPEADPATIDYLRLVGEIGPWEDPVPIVIRDFQVLAKLAF